MQIKKAIEYFKISQNHEMEKTKIKKISEKNKKCLKIDTVHASMISKET